MPLYICSSYLSRRNSHQIPLTLHQLYRSLIKSMWTASAQTWQDWKGGFLEPIKPFVYHSFHDYLASHLSWKDLEEVMDKACDELQDLIGGPLPSFASDVWQVEFLQSFQGPTPGRFVVNRENKGCYISSLYFDTLNVEGMCIQGALAACSLILMVCLNLPPHLHYKLEYMYIARIIPGPKQPTETELNRYFRLLIDYMKQPWKLGVKYTMTASFPEGHITWSTIAIAVTDLPAAWHLSQLVGHSANIYCTVCKCHQRSTLGRVNCYNWELWDDEEICQHTEEWRDMVTLKDHKSIFNKYSNCYSELWQLPYWPISCQSYALQLCDVDTYTFPVYTAADFSWCCCPYSSKACFLAQFCHHWWKWCCI